MIMNWMVNKMQIQNMIGLEAEFFLRNKKRELVFPSDYGFSTDDFPILAEFRAQPGRFYSQTVGNFFDALAAELWRAKDTGLTPDFSGWAEVPSQFRAKVLRRAGRKDIPMCMNVNKTDLLTFSDDIVENGTVVASRISAGLHVHFSRKVLYEYTDKDNIVHKEEQNILTPSQIKNIVRKMDRLVYPKYKLEIPLKYRQPGFYEMKFHGFEYRSLPMTSRFLQLDEVMGLVSAAFSMLENLEK